MVDCEDCDSRGYKRYDEVFVEGVGLSKDGEVKEHYGEELAGFGEDEGYVVDVGERGVAEGGGEGGGYGDQGEGEEDGARGEDGRCGCGGGGREQEVAIACYGGEGRLDGVEEDGVSKAFGRGGWAVSGCSYSFLEECPGETVDVNGNCQPSWWLIGSYNDI